MPIHSAAWSGIAMDDITQAFIDLNQRVARLLSKHLGDTESMKCHALTVSYLVNRHFVSGLRIPVALFIPEIPQTLKL